MWKHASLGVYVCVCVFCWYVVFWFIHESPWSHLALQPRPKKHPGCWLVSSCRYQIPACTLCMCGHTAYHTLFDSCQGKKASHWKRYQWYSVSWVHSSLRRCRASSGVCQGVWSHPSNLYNSTHHNKHASLNSRTPIFESNCQSLKLNCHMANF